MNKLNTKFIAGLSVLTGASAVFAHDRHGLQGVHGQP